MITKQLITKRAGSVAFGLLKIFGGIIYNQNPVIALPLSAGRVKTAHPFILQMSCRLGFPIAWIVPPRFYFFAGDFAE